MNTNEHEVELSDVTAACPENPDNYVGEQERL